MKTDFLQSPAGFPVRLEGDELVCMGTAKRYPIIDGTPHLFDKEDVSPFLTHDQPWVQLSHDRPDLRQHAQWEAIETSYQRARAINTGFLFSMLEYERPNGRRVLECGVGACDLIRRFSRAGMEAIAVDFFPWDMQSAKVEALSVGEPGFACIAAPMARLPFADASMDIVYFHAAIHHALPRRHEDFRWSDPGNLHDCLSEIRRVLKPRDQGGAFFLLGEGIYPESFTPADRVHESQCQKNLDVVYESWYKISEYEQAYRHAGIFPNLFLWQESYVLEAIGYAADGTRFDLVSPEDQISDNNYWKLSHHIAAHAAEILPTWIKLDVKPDPFAGVFDNDFSVLTSMHTQAGRIARIGVNTVFTAEPGAEGFLMFGPYAKIGPGRYEVAFAATKDGLGSDGVLTFDVLAAGEPLCPAISISVGEIAPGVWRTFSLQFEAPHGAEQLETRALLSGKAKHAVSVLAATGLRMA